MNPNSKQSSTPFPFFCKLLAACLCLSPAILPPSVRAQSAATGSVSGQVTDQQNGAIVGAAVSLTDLGTNAARSATTNEAGRYDFVNIPPGKYDLTVSKPGFSQAKISHQTVQVGLALTLDVVLHVGGTATTVEVSASAGAELQTMNATVGSTISGDSIVLLPNLNRDTSSLSTLQVAVAPGGQVARVLGAYARKAAS